MRRTMMRILMRGMVAGWALSAVGGSPPPLVPAPRSEDWWQGMHKRFVETARAGEMDVLFVGDSITARFAVGAGATVWRQLAEKFKAGNFGIEGDRVEHILWRLENGELDGPGPKVVVLLAGINNSWGPPEVDEETRGRYIAEGIRRVVATIREKQPRARILLLATFPRGDGTPKSIHVSNGLIAKLDDGKTVRFLDLGPKLAGPDGKVDKAIMPDGLHPSEKGYEIWAEAMKPLLDPWLEVSPPRPAGQTSHP